jgi:hypothetical protein
MGLSLSFFNSPDDVVVPRRRGVVTPERDAVTHAVVVRS